MEENKPPEFPFQKKSFAELGSKVYSHDILWDTPVPWSAMPGALIYSESGMYLAANWSVDPTVSGTLYQIGSGATPMEITYTPAADCYAYLYGGVAFAIDSAASHQFMDLCVYRTSPSALQCGSNVLHFPVINVGAYMQVHSKRQDMTAGIVYTFDLRIGQKAGTPKIIVYADSKYTFLRMEVFKKLSE